MLRTPNMGIPAPNYYPQPVAEGPVARIAADELLKADLRAKIPETALGDIGEASVSYNNAEVAARIRPDYSERQLDRFEQKLDDEGVFTVPITWREMQVERVTQLVPLVGATELATNHGDMSSMIYLRDHIQVARSYMELALQDPTRYAEKGNMGRQLLLSAMHLMSTPHQLDRFDNVINVLGAKAEQKDWPFISFKLDDLEATKPNGWRNNQDSFQMLTDATFDAINRGFIGVEDLTESHKKFLGSIVPFLESVGFPRHKSSGSWEEYAGRRTSVMSVETAMLHKMRKALDGPNAEQLAFLQTEYTKHGGEVVLPYKLDTMVRSGLEEIGRRWPYESPDYEQGDIKYREADAALTYGLMYDIPDLLEEYQIPIACMGDLPASVITLEHLLLEQLDSLIDPETGSMQRYKRDSYLRRNFLTHEIQANVATVKAHVAKLALRLKTEPDLEMKQRLRNGVVPQGREAAWPHPVAQLSAWAARREIRAQNLGQSFEAERYHRLSIEYLNQCARSITGTQQYHVVRQEDGGYGVQQVAAFRVPEAMVTYSDKKGDLIVPSPHTQLNWAANTVGEAFKLCRVAAHVTNAHRLGAFSVRKEIVSVAA